MVLSKGNFFLWHISRFAIQFLTEKVKMLLFFQKQKKMGLNL